MVCGRTCFLSLSLPCVVPYPLRFCRQRENCEISSSDFLDFKNLPARDATLSRASERLVCGFRKLHSQMTNTRQPSSFSLATTSPSWRRLWSSFFFHHMRRVWGRRSLT